MERVFNQLMRSRAARPLWKRVVFVPIHRRSVGALSSGSGIMGSSCAYADRFCDRAKRSSTRFPISIIAGVIAVVGYASVRVLASLSWLQVN